MCWLITGLAGLIGPGDASPLPTAELPSYGGLLLKTIGALILVTALIWALFRWGLPRLLGRRAQGDADIRVVSRHLLDGRRSVVLVEAYGRYLLLGVADGSVTLLAELDPDAVSASEARRDAAPSRRFADVLLAALGRPPTTKTAPGGNAPVDDATTDDDADDDANNDANNDASDGAAADGSAADDEDARGKERGDA